MRSTFCALTAAAVGLCLATAPHTARASEPSLQTEDGKTLHAIAEERADAAKGVVLVHMLGRDASDWKYFAARLNRSGFTECPGPARTRVSDSADAGSRTPTPPMVKDGGRHRLARSNRGRSPAWAQHRRQPLPAGRVERSGRRQRGRPVPGAQDQGVTAADALGGTASAPRWCPSDDDVYSAKSAMILEESAGQFHFELLERLGTAPR